MRDKQHDRNNEKRDHKTKRTPPSSSPFRDRFRGFGRGLIGNVFLLFAGAGFRGWVILRGRRIPGEIRGRWVFVRHALFFKPFGGSSYWPRRYTHYRPFILHDLQKQKERFFCKQRISVQGRLRK